MWRIREAGKPLDQALQELAEKILELLDRGKVKVVEVAEHED